MTARDPASDRVPIPLPIPELAEGPVRLRPPGRGDIDAVASACRDADIRRFTRMPPDYDRDDAVAFVVGAAERRAAGISVELVATDRPDGTLCGVVGLVVDRHDRARAEIGYWTHPAHRGRGVAAAALRLLSMWALGPGGFVRLDLIVSVENGASLAVVQRSAFVREGTARAAWPAPDGRHDMAVFSLIARDLQPGPDAGSGHRQDLPT